MSISSALRVAPVWGGLCSRAAGGKIGAMRIFRVLAVGVAGMAMMAAGGAERQVAPGAAASSRPASREAAVGYLGVDVRDIPGGHTIFSWFFPGPLQGAALEAAEKFDLARPVLLVAVDGQPMNAQQFKEYVESRSPGTQVTLEYRRSNARGAVIPDALNHEEAVRKLTLTVDSAEKWRGTEGRTRRSGLEVSFGAEALLDPDVPQNPLGAAIAEHGLAEPLSTLRAAFVMFRDKVTDAHQLSRVRAGFTHPFRLPELEQMVTQPTHSAPGDPFGTAAKMIRENLDAGPAAPSAIDR